MGLEHTLSLISGLLQSLIHFGAFFPQSAQPAYYDLGPLALRRAVTDLCSSLDPRDAQPHPHCSPLLKHWCEATDDRQGCLIRNFSPFPYFPTLQESVYISFSKTCFAKRIKEIMKK